MLITNLEDAEQIVKRNPMLEWDGWTIVHMRRNNAAWMQRNGVIRNGLWYQRTRIVPDRKGWNVPKKYIR